MWLEAVARILHDYPTGLALCSGTQYLEQYPRAGFLAMKEGSWGAHGNNEVWLNGETSWTYGQLYPAELYIREVATTALYRDAPLAERIAKQLCRELMLMESSDWQFLITTGAARDYAELRFDTHHDQFNELRGMYETFLRDKALSPELERRLVEIEQRDNLFPDIDPAFWAMGAKAERSGAPTHVGDVHKVPGGGTSTGTHDATVSELPKFQRHESGA
jgi:1,4-alpha-glucan branching enzyme